MRKIASCLFYTSNAHLKNTYKVSHGPEWWYTLFRHMVCSLHNAWCINGSATPFSMRLCIRREDADKPYWMGLIHVLRTLWTPHRKRRLNSAEIWGCPWKNTTCKSSDIRTRGWRPRGWRPRGRRLRGQWPLGWRLEVWLFCKVDCCRRSTCRRSTVLGSWPPQHRMSEVRCSEL